jgi:hypothetical protein
VSKLPSMQFYPGDWMKDPLLRMASASSRGIWIDFICASFEAPERGALEGTPAQFCKLLGCSTEEFSTFLSEAKTLRFANVLELSARSLDALRLECRRMLRDEKQRRDWAKQKSRQRHRGDTPEDSGKRPQKVRDPSGQCPPVSSSSSSSSERREAHTPSRSGIKIGMPPDMVLSDDLRKFALAHGCDPEIEFQRFRADASAEDRRHVRWAAAFQKWVLNSEAWRKERNGAAASNGKPAALPPTTAERLDARRSALS